MLQQVGRECISFCLSTVRIFRVKAYGQDSLFFWSVPKVMVCRGFQFYYATDHQKLHLLVSFLGETLLGNTQYPVYIRFLESSTRDCYQEKVLFKKQHIPEVHV